MSAAGKFVSHTNGTRTIDGASGKNDKMERGSSVSANPIWEPAIPNSPKQRFGTPKYAQQTGGYGEVTVRETPLNQHGLAGKVEPSKPQPDLKGHNAAPHTKRP
jgi:hypothetical protein